VVFCRSLINYYLPEEWKSDNIDTMLWTDTDWDEFDRQLQEAAQIALSSLAGAEQLGLFTQHEKQSVATAMERYLILSSADTSQPWLARMMMERRGIAEGDMLNPEFRGIGSWSEPQQSSQGQQQGRVYKQARLRRRKD
jgi:hypothetical protein